MNHFEVLTESELVEKVKKYFKQKAVLESLRNSITTVDQAEEFLWETDHKPIMFAKIEEKLTYLLAIYNYRLSIPREPELHFHANIRNLVDELESSLFKEGGMISVTKIYYILRTLFNLRKSLNKNPGEDEGSLKKIKMNLIALVTAIEKNGLLEKYKNILFARNDFLEEMGITVFSEQ